MDVDCGPGLADGVVFGDGDEDFLAYCADEPPDHPTTPDVVAPRPIPLDAEAAVEKAAVDEAVEVELLELSWEGFLLAHGVTWDGDEELWEPFRHWFAHHAAAQGFQAQATTFLHAMDRQPDRVRAFARYGIPVARPVEAPAQEPDPARCPYDLAAWTGYLGGRGATWDGGDASWPDFRTGFLAGAESLGLAIPATAFVEYVDSQPDRVTVFRQYGLLPPAPARRPSPRPRADAATAVPQDIPAGTPTETGATIRTATAAVPSPRSGKKAADRKPAVRNVSGTVKPPRARSSSRRTAA
jgi:hypothetical protein